MPSESIGHDADLAVAKAHMRAGDTKEVRRRRADDSGYAVVGIAVMPAFLVTCFSPFVPGAWMLASVLWSIVIVFLGRRYLRWRRQPRQMDNWTAGKR